MHTLENYGDVLIAHLFGILDQAGAEELRGEVEEKLLGRKRKLVLDLREVDALDPLGMGGLLGLARWTGDDGFKLRIANAAPKTKETLLENRIANLEFFPSIEEACRFDEAGPPPRVSPAPYVPPSPPLPPAPVPRPRPRPGFFRRHGLWLGLAAAVALIAVGGYLTYKGMQHEPLEFVEAGGKKWSRRIEIVLKPGETQTLKFTVKHASQVLPTKNEDWIRMNVESGDDKQTWEVSYEFAPTTEFTPEETFFYAIDLSGEGRRQSSPKIYLICDAPETPPKFDVAGREKDKSPDGKEGYPLAQGEEGQSYGPDGIHASGGADIRYSAVGHEAYGLTLDPVTGRFSGDTPKPTPDGAYVPVEITARNAANEQDKITLLLAIAEKKVEPESPRGRANLFAEEIDKRFKLVDRFALAPDNIKLLLKYKEVISEKGEGEIHRVPPIHFGLGKSELGSEHRRRLDEAFEDGGFKSMAGEPETYFFVLGFADKGKTADSVNKGLIEKRASNLADYLSKTLREEFGLKESDIAKRVKTIPMLPVPDEASGVAVFGTRESSRAGEIWLIRDPRDGEH